MGYTGIIFINYHHNHRELVVARCVGCPQWINLIGSDDSKTKP